MMISSYSSMHGTMCVWILSCLIAFALLCQTEGYSLAKHIEFSKTERSCPELDNCDIGNKTKLLSPTIQRSCACDIECNKFEDCCIDAPKSNVRKSDMKCYDIQGLGGVYMISKCPAAYNGDVSWRELCEDMEVAAASDPLGSVPVTDPDTGTTYKNFYCKLCNGKLDLMTFWKTKLDCPFLSSFNGTNSITEDYIWKNLEKRNGTWGLDLETVDDGKFFLECNVEAVIPTDLRNRVRRCQPNLISDCLPSWENRIIREKCKSFLGPRFTDAGDGYRNMYCAICNNVNADNLSCISPNVDMMKLFRFNAGHSFAVLLDINFKRGERVGMTRLCKSGSVFDPYFKKCRELQCLPGFVRRGLKCFPRRSVNKGKTVRRPVKRYRRVYATSTSKPNRSTYSDRSETSEYATKNVSYGNNQSTSVNISLYTTSISLSASNTSADVYESSNASKLEANMNK